MNTPRHTTSGRPVAKRPGHPREQGWVLLGALVLSTIAASLTMAWARHAVLAKGDLEMAHGASETEENVYSGMQRCREKMRNGKGPGVEEDGEEDLTVTETGDHIKQERRVTSYNRREIECHAYKPGGDWSKEARCKAKARISPKGKSRGRRTRCRQDSGSNVMSSPDLRVISGDVTLEGEQEGILLLEEGCRLTLKNCRLKGSIVTRCGTRDRENPLEDNARPRVKLKGGCRVISKKSNTPLPDVAMCAPDAVFEVDEDGDDDGSDDDQSRVEIEGMTIVDEIDFKNRRCTVRGMVVAEKSEKLGNRCKRPGFGRGTQNWPNCVDAGAERVDKMCFPVDPYTSALLTAMENFDASSYDY